MLLSVHVWNLFFKTTDPWHKFGRPRDQPLSEDRGDPRLSQRTPWKLVGDSVSETANTGLLLGVLVCTGVSTRSKCKQIRVPEASIGSRL